MKSPSRARQSSRFRRSVGLVLAPAVLLGAIEARAQRPPAETVSAVLSRLREAPQSFEDRREALEVRLAGKRALLTALQEELSNATGEEDSAVREHRVSRYEYQTFLVASRIAAEEGKLREIEALLALAPQLGAVDIEDRVAAELEAAVRDRQSIAARLLAEARDRASRITEETFTIQLDRLRADLEAEVERRGDGP